MLETFAIDTEDLGRHLYIEASAGTGKTYTINQIVKKIVGGGVPLEKVLIVTYTDKATGELKDRIRKTMQEAELEARLAKNELLGQRFMAARQAADNAAIFTIHSFCQRTLSEFAFSAGTAASLDIIDDSSVEEVIDRWIRNELSKSPAFCDLYAKKDDLPKKLRKQLADGVKNYYLDLVGREVPEIVRLEASDGSAKDAGLYRYLETLLPEAYMRWQGEKAARKVQSYDDMLRSVREGVMGGSALKKNLQEKYRYAIIDEFQDTNQRQWDIFRTVFMDSSAGAGEHTLIVVGDPKQSIYAFQGANVQVYKKATEEIANGRSLRTNWRSSVDMIQACNAFFSGPFFADDGEKSSLIDFTPSDTPREPDKQLQPPLLYQQGQRSFVKPFQLALHTNSENFALSAVNEIISYCSLAPDGFTRLQIWDKKAAAYRSVQFGDFAVLARTRREMKPIEAAMKSKGLPFRRYKDENLFGGIECQSWIALFKAVAAADFTGRKRQLLTECLYTHFFRARKEEPAPDLSRRIEDPRYDSPECPERQLLAAWHSLAEKGRWAELLERIYKDTGIETRFSTPKELDSLARLRQIGDYAVDYAYAHRCTLPELVDHLGRLASRSESAEEGGALVAKNTDFNCVQVMTIHASKGLEFPVVVSVAGFQHATAKNSISMPCLYHDGSNHAFLSFDVARKEEKIRQDLEEWRRLFYVAYTRAASLLLLPEYSEWQETDKRGAMQPCFGFLRQSFAAFIGSQQQFYGLLADPDSRAFVPYGGDAVKAILARATGLAGAAEKEGQGAQEAQRGALQKTARAVASSGLQQHSYTSLSKEGTGEKGQEGTERFDTDGQLFSASSRKKPDLSSFDPAALQVPASYDAAAVSLDSPLFPKGKHFGIALHEVFEKADFAHIAALADEQAALADGLLRRLISSSFAKEAIPMADEAGQPTDSALAVARMVWHTMQARLPEIQGGRATGADFSLGSLAAGERRAEVAFALAADEPLHHFCKGFVDLLFVRQVAGQAVYSVLDWKSDVMEEGDYKDGKALAEKISSDYAIQRVLYSYSLVIWLGQFYPEESEAEIFNRHFGGIYYVLSRGCHSGTGNGIYAQTWKDWQSLKSAFEVIRNEKMEGRGKKK